MYWIEKEKEMIKSTRRASKVWVTFTVDAKSAEKIYVKGSWDDWKPKEMKRKKSGEFYLTKVLPAGECFEFGYLDDGGRWFADDSLETVESPFGGTNSLLKL